MPEIRRLDEIRERILERREAEILELHHVPRELPERADALRQVMAEVRPDVRLELVVLEVSPEKQIRRVIANSFEREARERRTGRAWRCAEGRELLPHLVVEAGRYGADDAGITALELAQRLVVFGAPRLGDADDARFVHEVSPFVGDARAEQWLKRLYRQSATSIRLAKTAFRIAQAGDFEQRLAEVERLYLHELMKTADANEGLNAFIEKRSPRFRGR